MLSLNLEVTPQQYRLERNAAPHLSAIRSTIGELTVACDRFRGSHDTRSAMQKLLEQLTKQMEELSEVRGNNIEADATEQLYISTQNRFRSYQREIERALPHLYSPEEGEKPIRKKIGYQLARITAATTAFSVTNDTRPEIIAAAQTIKPLVDEALVLDRNIDPWMPNAIRATCDRFVQEASRPIVPAAPSVVDGRMPDAKRVAVMNALDDVLLHLGGLGGPPHGGREHVEPILQVARTLRANLMAELQEPLADTSDLRTIVLKMRVDVQLLDRLVSEHPGVGAGFMHFETGPVLQYIAALLKTLGAPTEILLCASVREGAAQWAS